MLLFHGYAANIFTLIATVATFFICTQLAIFSAGTCCFHAFTRQ